MLANRIGKHPELQNTEERKIERMLSASRKEMTLAKLRDDACNLLLDYAELFDNNDDKTNVDWARSKYHLIQGTDAERQEFLAAVEAFAAARTLQKDLKFTPFIQARQNKEMADMRFRGLAALGINFSEEIKKYQGDFRKKMEQMTRVRRSDEDYNLLMTSVIQNHAQLTLEKFTPLPWDPHRSTFEEFCALLKNHGPFVAGGRYGQHYYDSKSDHRLSIGNAQLSIGKTVKLEAQYWKAEERLSADNIGHMVVVVGVHAKGNAKLVLFVDPEDASTADQPTKLYAMSYKTFCEYAAVGDVIQHFSGRQMDGYLYSSPPEPENPKLKMRY
jgi:hypothetical protein